MRTRFAPSPTGFLHLGNAYSALVGYELARHFGGEFLIRIEDIDQPRCTTAFEAAIFEDLRWLGLDWVKSVLRQSDRHLAYHLAVEELISQELCYPCRCTRKDIQAALSAPQEGASGGPDGPVYPGTCRHRSMTEAGPNDAIRLDMARAWNALKGRNLYFQEFLRSPGNYTVGADIVATCGDIVVARKDIGTSYHVAVVVDDAFQQITDVVRGEDMFSATPIHVVLQSLLSLPMPNYHHHRLVRDVHGKRISKREDGTTLQSFRNKNLDPDDLKAMITDL
jgi:glutamyl-Q tRNA(Asp) synthetase